MEIKNLKLIIGSCMLLVLLLLGLYSFKDIKYSSNEGLSYDEKKRDAQYLMNLLENTYPHFQEIKEEGGQDIVKLKSKIISSLAKTSSDEEFYAGLLDLFRKFTYGEVGISRDEYPMSHNYHYLDKNLDLTRDTYIDKVKEGRLKWDAIESNYASKLFTGEYEYTVAASYFQGEYFVVMSQDPKVNLGDRLIAINGIPMDEYAKNSPNDKYFKSYDYNYDKYKVSYPLSYMDKNIKKITVKKITGEESNLDLKPYDASKPILENLYEGYTGTNVDYTERNRGNFLNYIEESKVLALNFSKHQDSFLYFNDLNKNHELFSTIDKSNYLVLDLRLGVNENEFLEVLNYLTPEYLEYSDYKVIKKSEINEEYVNHLKDKLSSLVTEVTTPIDSLEKHYPLSKYHIFKEKVFTTNGKNKYHGKIFILINSTYASGKSTEMLKMLIDNNIATVISKGKINPIDFDSRFSTINFLLPNSNIALQSSAMKTVDEEGVFIEKKVVTPQIIIKKDNSNVIEALKESFHSNDFLKEDVLYTEEDEYYREVLKLIK